MPKQFLFHDDARTALAEGVSVVAAAVRMTLGPRGSYAILGERTLNVTREGSAVANAIKLSDPYLNMGVSLVKEAANKTEADAGGGSTTTILITDAILREGMKAVSAGGNPVFIARGIQRAIEKSVSYLQAHTRPIRNREELERLASNVAGDSALGLLVVEAAERTGPYGYTRIESGVTLDSQLVVKDGKLFSFGYTSPYFVSDTERMEAVLENPLILVYSGVLSSITPIVPLLEQTVRLRRPLLIVAEEVIGEALATLVSNTMRRAFQVCAVKPFNRDEPLGVALGDIASITGATLVTSQLGIRLEDITTQQLGSAIQTITDKERTVVIGGSGLHDVIEELTRQLIQQLDASDGKDEQKEIRERLARLRGRIAQIRVGAATQSEGKEKQRRCEQADAAIRGATMDGVLLGGGLAYLMARRSLVNLEANSEERLGTEAVRRALEEPLRLLAGAVGYDGAVVAAKVQTMQWGYGFNAVTERFEDLAGSGIIDPAGVAISVLRNSASIAGLILNVDLAIAESDGGFSGKRTSAAGRASTSRRLRARTQVGREIRQGASRGRISFEFHGIAGLPDVPVEVRRPDVEMGSRSLASRSLDLEPGNYSVTAWLPDGTELGIQVGVAAGIEVVVSLDSELTVPNPWSTIIEDELQLNRILRHNGSDHISSIRLFTGDVLAGNVVSYEISISERVYADRKVGYRLVQLVSDGSTPQNTVLPASNHQPAELCASIQDDGSLIFDVRFGEPHVDALLHYWEKGMIDTGAALLAASALDLATLIKAEQAVSAALVAYVHLRGNQLVALVGNSDELCDSFPWLPDGLIIRAEHLARLGEHEEALELLLRVPERGLPVFTDGLTYTLDRLRQYKQIAVFSSERCESAQLLINRLDQFARQSNFRRPLVSYSGSDPTLGSSPGLQSV